MCNSVWHEHVQMQKGRIRVERQQGSDDEQLNAEKNREGGTSAAAAKIVALACSDDRGKDTMRKCSGGSEYIHVHVDGNSDGVSYTYNHTYATVQRSETP